MMTLFKRLKLQPYWILLVLWTIIIKSSSLLAAQVIDLSKAIIVTSFDNPKNISAAEFLKYEIYSRTGISLEVTATMPENNSPAVVLCHDTDFPIPVGLSVPAKPESYAIWVDTAMRIAPTVLLVGRDERGVLFGAGKLLQELFLSEMHISVERNLALAEAPADRLRAQQIITNTQGKDGFLDWRNEKDVRQFIRDMVIFGTNGFEPTEPELIDDYLEELGIDLFIKLRCQDIIDLDEKTDLELKNLYNELVGIDHITTYGGDASGAVKPQLFFPHMERVLPLILKGQPGVKWWYSNQCLEDHAKDEDKYIFNYINSKRPSWLYGMVYGPWTKRGIQEIRKELPSQYELRHFPDICHPRWCQYPVPGWDRIFAIVWPRNQSIYTMPSMMQDVYLATRDNTMGSLPYNHTGVYNDINKFAWSAAAWNPEESTDTFLYKYAKVFLAHDFIKSPEGADIESITKEELIDQAAKAGMKGLMLLEKNWVGPIAENTGIEATLKQWELIADCIGGPGKNWRVELFLYKARIDAQIKRKYDLEMKLEKEAYNIMADVEKNGIESVKKNVKNVLARIEFEFQPKENFLLELKKMGLTGKYGDLNEIAENIYTSFNDRYWIEEKVSKAESNEDLSKIIHYEDPGKDGFYDNLGVQGEQPHLVHPLDWNTDPGFVHSCIEWVDNADNSNLRHSQHTHALARYESPLLMKWNGLDKKGSYQIRVVYNGPFDIDIKCQTDEGILVHDFIPKTKDTILTFPVPVEATSDGELQLQWNQGTENLMRGVSVSEIWLEKIR